MKIGLGFDTHPFDEQSNKPLILGGVIFEGEPRLKGHSDADVVAHSCSDALLGAAGLGDMGELFPDTDPKFKNADSMQMLKEVVEKVRAAGFEIANIDCVIIADKPKIAPQKQQLKENLSKTIEAPVNIGGKRTEGMLTTAEGITCFSVALLTESN